MTPMSIEDALQRCIRASLGDEMVMSPYTAACRVMSFTRSGKFSAVEANMTEYEFMIWSTSTVRQNCAWALEQYAEKYGALTP